MPFNHRYVIQLTLHRKKHHDGRTLGTGRFRDCFAFAIGNKRPIRHVRFLE